MLVLLAHLADTNLTIFIYGSEFSKGTNGMEGSLEADDLIFECEPQSSSRTSMPSTVLTWLRLDGLK